MPLAHWKPNYLTRRHREALLSIAKGDPIKITADSMGVSFSTAKHHRQAVLDFFGAHSKAEAVAKAIKTGHLKLEQL